MPGRILVRKVSGKGEGRTSLQLIRPLITPCFTPTDLSSSVGRSSQSQQSAMNTVRFKALCRSCKCEIRQKVRQKETFFLSWSTKYFLQISHAIFFSAFWSSVTKLNSHMTGWIIWLFDDIFFSYLSSMKKPRTSWIWKGKAVTHFPVSHIPMSLEYDVRVNTVTSDGLREK